MATSRQRNATRGWLRSLAAATLIPSVTFGLQWLFWPHIKPFAWFVFYPAVFISSWLGGFYAGLGCTVFGSLIVWWEFIPPARSFAVLDTRFFLTGAVYVTMGVVLSALQERLRRASREAAAALEASQRDNEKLQKAIAERQVFAAFVENSSDFIGIADPDGKPVYVNPAGRKMVGLDPDYPVQDTQIAEYYPADQRAFATSVIVKGMVEKGSWKGETYFRNWKTDTAIPVSDTHFMIREPGTNRLLGMGTITRDISDIKQANEEIRLLYEKTKELDALKTQFFANLSHELRTPLALILGPTERLLRAPEVPESARADLEVVARNARSLLAHVTDLLDITKLDAGRLKPDYAEVDVARLVRFVAGHFEVLSKERGIDLRVESPDGQAAEVDPDMLQRMLMNLLSNAFKFTPSDGRVRVSLRDAGDRFVVEVADSGPGIPEDKRVEVFERFSQLEAGPTRRFAGTGLGLAIVKDFATVLHGNVSITDAPEGGALFVLDLPRAAPAGSAVRPSAAFGQTPSERREPPRRERPAFGAREDQAHVLVVEDNAEMRAFIAEGLERSGLRVTVARDGREGYDEAIRLRPDLVLTDIMMPAMSGDELVGALRKHAELGSTPIVVLTAKADDELRIRLLQKGAEDYLTKPFSEEELIARVWNHVARKRAEDRSHRLREQVESVAQASMAVSEAVAGLPEASLQAVLETIARYAKDLADAEFAAARIGRDLGMPAGTWAVPIQYRSREVGTLYLGKKRGGGEFDEHDRRVVQMLAARAGVAIQTARLYATEGTERAWLKAVVEQLPEGIVLMDAAGQVTLENQTVRALAGARQERDRFGNPIMLDLRRPSGEAVPEAELANVRALVREETTQGLELVARRADGRAIPVLVSASPVRDADGAIVGATMVIQDISTLKELERLREEWASIVAHDLQQPIHAIVLRCDLLMRAGLGDAQRKDVSHVRAGAMRLSRMVRDLLDASQLETHRMQMTLERLDVEALVHDVITHLPDAAARTTIRSPAGQRLFVRGDAGRLEQVLTNLVSNALKYGATGTSVAIDVVARGDTAEISVKNRGRTIPADELGVLFDRYVRSRGERARRTKGLGLGLYIAKGLVEAHGGKIWVTSAEDETTFFFTIPLDGPPVAAESGVAGSPLVH